MRVLQVIQEMEPGGAEGVVLALRDHLGASGHEVAVAAAPGPRAAALGLPDARLPLVRRRPAALVAAAVAVRGAIRALRPDVVHAHNPVMALAVSGATRRGRSVPGVVTCHGVPEDEYRAAARALRLAGLPVVGCGPGVTAALEDAGVAGATTIVNGISEAPAPRARGELASELGLKSGAPLLVAVGRLVPQKNHALAVEATAQVPGASLVVVGGGPLHGELDRLTRRLGIAERVRLLGARHDARSILAAADVALLTSRWEGLPLVALETFAAGVPLVATAVRGIRELVTDGEDGLLVPPDDAAAVAAAVRDLLADPARGSRLGLAGRAVAARHTSRAMAADYERLYEGLLR